MIVHEPLIASFTGTLSSFSSVLLHKTFSLKKPYPRVQKGVGYMLVMDTEKNTVKMLPILT